VELRNIRIAALGRILEVVTGQPYDRFLANPIGLLPLKARRSRR
jgi:CubicO group peptidase (beta-lactamase class C family)